jgi:hypothetical protein
MTMDFIDLYDQKTYQKRNMIFMQLVNENVLDKYKLKNKSKLEEIKQMSFENFDEVY